MLAGSQPTQAVPAEETHDEPSAPPIAPCPEDMVLVAEKFCVDRYEATMVDRGSGRAFSPFYPPSKEVKKAVAGQKWGPAALGKEEIDPPVPKLPDWQRGAEVQARAVSAAHVTPQAYMSKPRARRHAKRQANGSSHSANGRSRVAANKPPLSFCKFSI